MDSINDQQTEENHEDLGGDKAVERIKVVVNRNQTCFFCTAVSHGPSGATRPMSVQAVDVNGDLWFLSASDSYKNLEIAEAAHVRLFFQASEHSGFLMLTGSASVSVEEAKIKRLWKPILKTWFTAGADDPRITAIRVRPVSGYYWDNKHGNLIAGAKILLGAAIGQTLDDSIEGQLSLR